MKMTCKECELALASQTSEDHAGEERIKGVEQHLADCAACRAFELELQANAVAFAAMAAEPMPAIPRVVRPIRASAVMPWAAAVVAIAAMILLMLTAPPLHRIAPPTKSVAKNDAGVGPSVEHSLESATPAGTRTPLRSRVKSRRSTHPAPQLLQVKMLTDDPNVVIYWQIENKKGTE